MYADGSRKAFAFKDLEGDHTFERELDRQKRCWIITITVGTVSKSTEVPLAEAGLTDVTITSKKKQYESVNDKPQLSDFDIQGVYSDGTKGDLLESITMDAVVSADGGNWEITFTIGNITAIYSDGTKETITDFTYTYEGATKHGEKGVIKVDYKGNLLQIKITNYDRNAYEKLSIAYVPEIKVGKEYPKNWIEITATTYGGEEIILKEDEFSFEWTPKSSAGEYELEITVGDISQTIVITVTES